MADTVSVENPVKKTKGQRPLPIPLKQIEDKTALSTTFCKRRRGLFIKANEICTLCAVQIAMIIFSPTGKTYTFGHPDVDTVMSEYLARNGVNVKDLPCHLASAKNSPTAEKMCEELAEAKIESKSCAKSGDELTKLVNANKKKSWWKKCVGNMNLSEVEECKKAMEELMAIAPEDT